MKNCEVLIRSVIVTSAGFTIIYNNAVLSDGSLKNIVEIVMQKETLPRIKQGKKQKKLLQP